MVCPTLMKSGKFRPGRVIAALSLISVLAACAGSSWDGRTFKGDSVQYHPGKVPSGWRRIETDDAQLAFRDSARDLLISVNGRCGKDDDDVPLEALTRHLFIYFTERQIMDQNRVMLDHREALRTELSAKLDGVARHFVVYVLKKNGCVYDFVLIAAPTVEAASIKEFDQFVAGFSTSATS